MLQEDAVKARIIKLEGDLLGLLGILKTMRGAPTLFTGQTAKEAFNSMTRKKTLHSCFLKASFLQQGIQQQVNRIQGEILSLTHSYPSHKEFAIAL